MTKDDNFIYLPMKNCVRTRYNFERKCFEIFPVLESSCTEWMPVLADNTLIDQLVSILFDRESDC
jgi:hypothetical protein